MSAANKNARTAAGAKSMDMPKAARADSSPRFATPQALERWFESRITRELERCRSCMSEAEWIKHRAWIAENARACLLDALRSCAEQGAL